MENNNTYFKNEYILSQKDMQHFTSMQYLSSTMVKLVMLVSSFLFLSGFLKIIFGIGKPWARSPWWDVLLPIFLIAVIIIRTFLTAKNNFFQIAAVNNGNAPKMEITFLKDKFYVTTQGSANKQTFKYSNIKKLLSSKEIYIIILSNNVALMLKKEAFTIGNKSEFENFLKSRNSSL